MGASQREQINWLGNLVQDANPACKRANCHGRGVTADSWSENQAPLGSGRYWPESFYEEDICECVKITHFEPFARAGKEIPAFAHRSWGYFLDKVEEWHETQGKDEFGNSLTLYQMAHWDCPQCKVDELQERRADDAQSFFYMEGQKEDYKNKVKDLEAELEERETETINADRNRRFRA